MKIIINNKEKKYNFRNKKLNELLAIIKDDLDQEIINKIYINDVEVNLKYLKDNLIEIEDIDILQIETQKIKTLIKSTLKEMKNYLPKLKNGCLDAAKLYRNGNINEANEIYQLILNGIDWYTKTISKIISLIDSKELEDDLEDELILLNTTLSELIKAHENKDNVLLADILEYELTNFIDKFILKNSDIITQYYEEKKNANR